MNRPQTRCSLAAVRAGRHEETTGNGGAIAQQAYCIFNHFALQRPQWVSCASLGQRFTTLHTGLGLSAGK